jgi:hypothetical protein
MARRTHLTQIRSLNVSEDYEAIHRLTVTREFPFDVTLTWQLAFYRVYGIPRIAELLHHTGHITGHALSRAEDTGLMIYEMVEHGLDHPRARTVLSMMNRMHRRWDIANDDYLYVLGTFILVPMRWLQRYGWRKPSPQELDAAHRFWREVGRRMNITGVPDSYADYERWFDAYERAHFRFTAANAELYAASRQLLADRFPAWMAPLVRRAGDTLLDAPLRAALGVPQPPWLLRAAVHLALRSRATVVRWLPERRDSIFTPGGVTLSRPHGYQLDELGVREHLQRNTSD